MFSKASLFFLLSIFTLLSAEASVYSLPPQEKVLVIPIDCTNEEAGPWPSLEEIRDGVFGITPGRLSLRGFLEENSYGRYTITGDVRDWASMQCGVLPFVRDTNYDRFIYIIEYGGSHVAITPPNLRYHIYYDWSKLYHTDQIGERTLAHEYGHSLGYDNHGSVIECLYPERRSIDYTGCTIGGFEPYNVMGDMGHFDAATKLAWGWLSSPNLQVVTASGQYTLEPYETNTAGVKALRVPRGQDGYGDLFIEYRQPIGYDASPTLGVLEGWSGPLLRTASGLIDASPEDYNLYKATLYNKPSFVDPSSGTVITVVENQRDFQNPANSRLVLQVTLGKGDLDAPITEIVSPPSPLQSVAGTITLKVSANDPSGVERVEWYIDVYDGPPQFLGTRTAPNPSSGLYELDLDTTTLPNGKATIEAKALDKSCNSVPGCQYGNIGQRLMEVIIANVYPDVTAPWVSIMEPWDSGDPNNPNTRPNPVLISSWASDFESAMSELTVFLDAETTPRFTATNTDPDPMNRSLCTTHWVILPAGLHSVYAKAKDFAGNEGQSSTNNFLVQPDNTRPTISWVTPAEGQTLSGNDVALTVDSQDNVLIERVEYYLDGFLLGKVTPSVLQPGSCFDMTPPSSGGTYMFNWNSLSFANSAYTLAAKAFDHTENVSTLATVSVNVSNPGRNSPILNTIGNRTVSVGEELTIVLSATDADGGVLAYAANPLPPGANFDPYTQTFHWTPSAGQEGGYPVTFRVTDLVGLSDSETMTIVVGNVNVAPMLDFIGDKAVNEGETLSFSVSASDGNGDALSFTATPLPAGAVFNSILEFGKFSNLSSEKSLGSQKQVFDTTKLLSRRELPENTAQKPEKVPNSSQSIGNSHGPLASHRQETTASRLR